MLLCHEAQTKQCFENNRDLKWVHTFWEDQPTFFKADSACLAGFSTSTSKTFHLEVCTTGRHLQWVAFVQCPTLTVLAILQNIFQMIPTIHFYTDTQRIIIALLTSHSPFCMVMWQMTQTLASFSIYFSLHLRLQQAAQYTCKADSIIHPKQFICEARGNTSVLLPISLMGPVCLENSISFHCSYSRGKLYRH